MKLVCPACGAVASIEAWSGNADARQLVGIISEMPTSIARGVLPYIALFRPAVPQNERGYRGLAWGKALRLASEIGTMVKETRIQWKGKPSRPIDITVWAMAIERVISNPPSDLPLDHHNYLRSIAYRLANDTDRKMETEHNKDERAGRVVPALDRAARSGGDLEKVDFENIMTSDEMRKIREQNMGRKGKHNGNGTEGKTV